MQYFLFQIYLFRVCQYQEINYYHHNKIPDSFLSNCPHWALQPALCWSRTFLTDLLPIIVPIARPRSIHQNQENQNKNEHLQLQLLDARRLTIHYPPHPKGSCSFIL
jgi:hypothetical protein